MPDKPLNESDELIRIARTYFARLASRAAPHSLERGAPFSLPPPRRPWSLRFVARPVVFLAIAAVLSIVIVSVGHMLTTRRSTFVAPPLSTPAVPAKATPPPGGPVPSALKGRWLETNPTLNPPPMLIFYADSSFELEINSLAHGGGVSFGTVVVNGNEIDFFNGNVCGIPLPGGVGRYRWTLHDRVLHFTPLTDDPCSIRGQSIANQTYSEQSG